jgi:hypothetical protein
MANVKITALTNLSSADVDAADVFVIDDVSASETKKITVANLQAAIDTIATSNINTVSANADAYYTQLNANINVVQDNVASLSTVLRVAGDSGADDVTVGTDDLTFTGDSNVSTAVTDNTVTISVDFGATQTNIDAVETRRADNVFFTYNSTGDQANVIVNAANVEPSQNNIFSLGAPDKVWKDLYVGPGSINLGNVILTAVETGIKIEDAQGATTQLDTSVANVAANLNLIQDNVAQVSQDVVAVESRRADNVTIRIDAFTGTNTAIVAAESRVNSNLDVTNDNVSSLTTTVDNFGTYANTNLDTKANVSATYFLALANDFATYTHLQANIDLVQDNVASVTVGTAADTETRLNANLDITNDNVSSLTTTVDNFGTTSNANASALAAGIVSSETRLNANLDVIQDNVAAIIDGSTSFTGDVTMNQALTVSGNLYVIGAQVDLGISSAQIDDATLLLAANTPADAQLGVDSGIVINRGQDANVFFGFAAYGNHIDFIFTDAPADNAAHYAIAYIDVHANSFGAEGTHDPTFTAVHHADRPTTGFYFPTNEIVGAIGGAYKANITASGLEAVAVYSDGVELQANDSATLFSAYANDYATHTQITANVDVVQDNVATLTTTVDNFGTSSNANAAALATGIATKLDSSDYIASDVLTKIKTVDGVGSGLDADLLDGQSSAYYAVEATRSSNAAALAAGIAGITPIGTSDISNGAVTVDKLAATLDLGALS